MLAGQASTRSNRVPRSAWAAFDKGSRASRRQPRSGLTCHAGGDRTVTLLDYGAQQAVYGLKILIDAINVLMQALGTFVVFETPSGPLVSVSRTSPPQPT
jgi:hypothetical protein